MKFLSILPQELPGVYVQETAGANVEPLRRIALTADSRARSGTANPTVVWADGSVEGTGMTRRSPPPTLKMTPP
jgi:hypothetical protein